MILHILYLMIAEIHLEDFKELFERFHTAFSIDDYIEEDLVAEGNRVVLRYTFVATQKAQFMGVPAQPPKTITVKAMALFVIDDKSGKNYGILGEFG